MWVKPIAILILTLLWGVPETSKQHVRAMYVKSVESKQTAQNLLSFLEKQEQNAFILGYRGATKMLMAKHAFNPFVKISHFNAGKRMLNAAILKDRTNVELIFLRYATQVSAPSILGYNNHIETDKKQILKGLSNDHVDDQVAKTIISFMKKQELTPQEVQQLTNIAK